MSRETDELLKGHEYDGIQEFNNPLPGWWLLTFFGTIIFAFIYYIHYEIAGGPSQAAELKSAMAQIQSMKKGGPVFSEEKLSAAFTQEALKSGQVVFKEKCAMCHGDVGEGKIGPNLTDKHWIHGKGTRADIALVISEGVLDKGMPAWGEQLTEKDLTAVAAFVYSVKNTFAAGGKPAQGNEVSE